MKGALVSVERDMESANELIVSFRTDEQGGLRYHSITAPDIALRALAGTLKATRTARAAFIKTRAGVPNLNIARASGPVVAVTPPYRGRQGYLDAAPGGVNVAAATGLAGSGGANVRVFDFEEDWEMDHEDRPINFLRLVSGEPSPASGADQDHGTAVMGVIAAADNAFGITGIAPDATVGLVRFKDLLVDSGNTIRNAVAALSMTAGDILVLPVERPGPRGGQPIAIEWWPDDFAAIRDATAKGIIVVEAAGNGGQNLDHPDYDRPQDGFPSDWSNPFRRGGVDSGAILVGAGIPSAGADDRSRHPDSNYGSAVDVQGWASDIFTMGYGDQNTSPDRKRFYTAIFGMTSGATAMIAGVLACVQGVRIAAGKPPWTPADARRALQNSGSPQQASASHPVTERIGSRPDLAHLIALALA